MITLDGNENFILDKFITTSPVSKAVENISVVNTSHPPIENTPDMSVSEATLFSISEAERLKTEVGPEKSLELIAYEQHEDYVNKLNSTPRELTDADKAYNDWYYDIGYATANGTYNMSDPKYKEAVDKKEDDLIKLGYTPSDVMAYVLNGVPLPVKTEKSPNNFLGAVLLLASAFFII